MADTAVGLFEDTFVSDALVAALTAHGLEPRNLRVLAQPKALPVHSESSTPYVDIAAGLALDIRQMGASEFEIEHYIDGLRHGHVILLATGTWEQAYAAVALMNQYGALLLEEYAGAAPVVPGAYLGEVGLKSGVTKSRDLRDVRVVGEGARLFTW